MEHVQACRPDVFLTTVSYPIKGTPYFNEVKDKLVRIGEWRTSTDREVRVKGRHSRRFYQFADDLLRSSVERPEDPRRIAAGSGGARGVFRRGGSMTTPFDALASSYNTLWNNTPSGRGQRQAVGREIDGLFRAGDRVLDLGCGPGDDALHLAESWGRGSRHRCRALQEWWKSRGTGVSTRGKLRIEDGRWGGPPGPRGTPSSRRSRPGGRLRTRGSAPPAFSGADLLNLGALTPASPTLVPSRSNWRV